MKKETKQTILFYLKHTKKHKWLAILTFVGLFIGIVSNFLFPIVIKQIVDLLSLGLDNVDMHEVWMLFVPLVGLYVINMIGWRLGVYSICLFEPKVMANMSNECFAEIHKHSYNFFNNEFVGSLVKRVSRMVRSFEAFFDVITFEMLNIIVQLIIGVTVLFWIHPVFGISMFVWAVIFLGFNYWVSQYKLKKYDIPKTEADSEVTGYLADTISNNVNIKLFSNHPYEKEQFGNVIKKWETFSKKSWLFNAHLEMVQNVFMLALELFMLYMAIVLWSEGKLTLGSFVLIETYLIEIFMSVWNFGRYIRRIYEAFADAEEMTAILNKPIEVRDKKGAKPIAVSRGKVEFKNVNFAYEKSDALEEDSVVKNLNLTIKPGERIALIGPSGGGKTTIVKLLLRLFDIQKGQILIDGQNISDATQDSVRSQIALVPQDPILFHRPLIENIRYGRLDASDEEVYAASKMAHCDKFISGFPKGYNTFVGERGVKLSGGERQRVAIARAILSNAKILVLDEATSSLDVHSEKLVQDALAQLTKNKTTIVIAHRLSTVKHVDRIIVLKEGKVVEEGTHKSLMEEKNSLYKSLWDLSVSGVIA